MTNTIHSATAPVATRANIPSAKTAGTIWVITSVLRLSNRSAIRPPHSPNSSRGRNCRATVTPSATPLPVRLSTSHPWATVCMPVPVSDTSWPAKNSR